MFSTNHYKAEQKNLSETEGFSYAAITPHFQEK